ncbi:SBF-like CPA transporter family-domain-containing protein [Xylariaceae sp. FL0016]|nr:SBF-like CPA transporter family-domain-containing protein [Xylariaceae sp. FL0016]
MMGDLPNGDGHETRIKQDHSPRGIRCFRGLLKFLWANWLTIGFGLGCVLGYYFPHVAARGGTIRSEYSILYGAIGLIFLINGMQLSPEKLKEHASNWRLHFVVQGISLVLIPVIQLVIIRIVIAAGGVSSGNVEPSILVGMVIVSCIPTTIASNVVMTRNSGGDEAAAIIEVVIGNVAGSFLSPWLIYGFLPTGREFDSLRPAQPSTLGRLYANVMKQLGLSVLVPLAVGQALRWTFPRQVTWTLRTFYLAQFCSVLLMMVAWSTFSGAFETGALTRLPTSSVLFNVFLNIAEYLLFTMICYWISNPPGILARSINPRIAASKLGTRLPQTIQQALTIKKMPREHVVAVCFCGAAKTTSLGIPLAAAMWSQLDNLTISSIQVPVLLYTVEQVFAAQFLTIFFKWWLRRSKKLVSNLEATAEDEQQEATEQQIELDQGKSREESLDMDGSTKEKGPGGSCSG